MTQPCRQTPRLSPVRRENRCPTALVEVRHQFAEAPSGGWVQADGRLVNEDNGRFSDESQPCAQTTLLPHTTETHHNVNDFHTLSVNTEA